MMQKCVCDTMGTKKKKEVDEGQCPEVEVKEPETVEEPQSQELEELRSLLAKKDALAQGYFAQLQRVQADFENYQKRVEAERGRIADNACESMICGLLETLDDFERALSSLENVPGEEVKGLAMVYDRLKGFLGENGLERIMVEGCQFDPRRHDAIMQSETDEAADGTVLEEFQSGYSVKGKVVRPAKVRVARAPAVKNEAQENNDDENGSKEE